MKIAMPYNGGRVNEHFGQSREFAIYTVEGGKITDSKIVNSQDLCHNHEGLAGILKDEGVETVIAGGIGQPMVVAFQAKGFKIITGASGDAARVAEDYASGSLVTSNIDICSCGDHEHHGH
jgi:predicted Fe-Mo cluster-binding NifX family protein